MPPVSPSGIAGINIGALHSDSSQSYEDQVAAKRPEAPEELGMIAKCLYILDTKFLKPALVYKYSQQKVDQDIEFFEQFSENASKLQVKFQGYSDSSSDRKDSYLATSS